MQNQPKHNHPMNHYSPRCLTKRQAADYCGLSLSGFAEWVRSGIVPPAIPKTTRWDKKAIDIALDRLSDITEQSKVSALDRWKATQAKRQDKD